MVSVLTMCLDFSLLEIYFTFNCEYVFMCIVDVNVHVEQVPQKYGKRVSDPLDLVLQHVVSTPCTRAVCTHSF